MNYITICGFVYRQNAKKISLMPKKKSKIFWRICKKDTYFLNLTLKAQRIFYMNYINLLPGQSLTSFVVKQNIKLAAG